MTQPVQLLDLYLQFMGKFYRFIALLLAARLAAIYFCHILLIKNTTNEPETYSFRNNAHGRPP